MKQALRPSVAFALSLVAAAAGAETGPYYLGGYVGYTHLSNVLGLPDGEEPAPGALFPSRSDRLTTLALIAGLDQPISRQRVFGDLVVQRNQFAKNERLDYTGYTAKGGLDWETAGNISGELTAKASRKLLNYGPTQQPTDTNNLETSKQVDATARLGGVTRLSLEAGGGWRALDYSDPGYDTREQRIRYAWGGVRWRPSPASAFGLAYRDTEGRYPRYRVGTVPQPDRFDRRDIDLDAKFELSGLTSLSARVSATKLDYDVQDLDFDGTTGYLRATWLPTAKLKLEGEVARDRGSDLRYLFPTETGFIDAQTARVATVQRLRADYAATAKLAFNATASRARRPVVVVVGAFPFTFTEEGRERATQYGVGAAWSPTRTSRIGCDWSKEKRRGEGVSFTGFNVTSSSFGCYAQLSIQP